MSFFSQTWFGVCKEFAIYKHHPIKLLQELASFILSALVSLSLGYIEFKGGSKGFPTYPEIIFKSILFYSPASGVLTKLVNDKENKFREYLLVNGMKKSSYQAKIALTSYILIFFITIEKSVESVIFRETFSFNVVVKLIPQYLLSGIAVINMGLFLSTFLNANRANIAALFVFAFVPFMTTVTIDENDRSYFAEFLRFFNPSIASNHLVQIFADLEESKQKIPLFQDLANQHPNDILYQRNLFNTIKRSERLASEWLWTLEYLLVSCLLYLGLYLFFEREKEIGPKKAKEVKHEIERGISLCAMNDLHPSSNDMERPLQIDITSSALYREEINKEIHPYSYHKTIQVKGLKKVYGQHTVLENVSFTIHEQEIFCLLGHNGAGKTTLVNILTGLIPLTEGFFYYNEKELFSNISKLRQSVGFCAQQDFALENNTIYENLEFFAQIKNVPKNQIKAEIDRLLSKFDLTQFQHLPASQLTSGWKRKLNIATALINDPKIIIMDEPTSGMDPVTRREYWEIIRKLKEEKKTILLTTQFLNEAEELCDRVAILSKGRLFAVGSVDYIKKKFGTGYNLIIQSSGTREKLKSQTFEIMTKIHSITPEAYQLDDSTTNILKYVLPFSEQNKFAQLFAELEKFPDLQINLQLISLEEAFVKLEINSDCIIGKPGIDNDEFKARLYNIPNAFYQDEESRIKDQILAMLLQRFYQFKENSKEKWSLFVSIVICCLCEIWFLSDPDLRGKDNEFITVNVLLSYSLLTPVMISFLSDNQKRKINHVLKVQGIRPFSYWFANLIADFIVQLPIMILVLSFFSKDPRFHQEQIRDFIPLFLAFILSLISFTYKFTQKYEFSWIGGPPIILASLIPASIIAEIIELIIPRSLSYTLLGLSFFLGPSITLFLGINRIINPQDPYDSDAISLFKHPLVYAIFLLILGVLDFANVVYSDSKVTEPNKKRSLQEYQKGSIIQHGQDAEDHFLRGNLSDEKALTQELQRLISRNNTDVIKVMDLRKTYKNGCKAIDNLNFGVEKGQIFCLLGTNGAGKTTCLEVLANKIPKTSGTVEIQDQDLADFYKDFNRVGVCSQINTLWKSLTVYHHLRVYARIKGLQGHEADEVIQYILDALQLEPYSQQKTSELSMGTQRKVCVALAVIGAPKVLFLDEPSTGVDAVGRNQIWQLVKTVIDAKKGAVVLTTHYMNEAELIGDKLGILVNGTLQTIGTLADLKKSHADYLITIKMIENSALKIKLKKVINFIIPEAVVDEKNSKHGEMVFQVPAHAMKFSKVFEVLEFSKRDEEIEEFSIYTTTLEQIFVNLVKDHIKESSQDDVLEL